MLIPVLVDENGQMYIVMTGQSIAVENIPSDYNQIQGRDGATPRYVAVDANGIILGRMKGAYGDTLKDLAVDDLGIILARIKGKYGSELKDIAVDTDGYLIAVMEGSDGSAKRIVKLDAEGNIIARMKGFDGSDLRDVKVDSSGYMLSKMLGQYNSDFKVIAVDSNGVMKANLSAQDLQYLKVRPTYGQFRWLYVGYVLAVNNAETTIHSISGRGAITGGNIVCNYGLSITSLYLRIYIDGTLSYQELFEDILNRYPTRTVLPLPSVLFAIPKQCNWIISYGVGMTFETSLEIKIYNTSGVNVPFNSQLYYTLTP